MQLRNGRYIPPVHWPMDLVHQRTNARLAVAQQRLFSQGKSIKRLLRRARMAAYVRQIPFDRLLMGGNPSSGLMFSLLSGDPITPSTSVASWPHTQFLHDYREIGEQIFDQERFTATAYCKYALTYIALRGRYFSATDASGVLKRARQFVRMFEGYPICLDDPSSTPAGEPVRVRRIRFSDCYEVIDGHHRLAVAAARGLERFPCAVMPGDSALTAMQVLVLESGWRTGRPCLLQPIEVPELRNWKVLRRCKDRLGLMMEWLNRNGICSGTFLDIGCGYGWFVAEMMKQNFDVVGVEQDAALATVGRHAYGLSDKILRIGDLVASLSTSNKRYDVVSCLSVLPYYLGGHFPTPPGDFIRLVDRATGSVLFFETAESHEGHPMQQTRGWDAGYISEWIRNNTSFTNVELLGKDCDGRGLLRRRYGRHLFACSRAPAAGWVCRSSASS